LVYSCDGGGTDRTKTNKPKCDKSKVTTAVTPPPPTHNKCFQYDAGKMNQMDLPGCGGSTDIVCTGGCITIHKVLYSCKEGRSNSEQLKLIRDRCQDQKKCKVTADRETFGDEECPDTEEDSMKLWLVYSCDGGEDLTVIRKPTCNQVISKLQRSWLPSSKSCRGATEISLMDSHLISSQSEIIFHSLQAI